MTDEMMIGPILPDPTTGPGDGLPERGDPGAGGDEVAEAPDAFGIYELIIEPLARGEDYATAGRRIGRSARAVRRQMTDPEYANRVRDRRREMVQLSTGRFNSALEQAVDAILGCLDSENDALRLRAARLVIEHGARLSDRQELEDLVRRLKAALGSDHPVEPGRQ